MPRRKDNLLPLNHTMIPAGDNLQKEFCDIFDLQKHFAPVIYPDALIELSVAVVDAGVWSDKLTTITDEASGVKVVNLNAGLSNTVKGQLFTGVSIAGREFRSRAQYKAVSGDAGKTVIQYLNRVAGGSSPADITTVTLTDEWQEVAGKMVGNASNTGIYLAVVSGTATQMYFRRQVLYEVE